MSDKDWRRRLDDILEHIAIIETFLAGKSETSFYEDPVLISAVERHIQIIGEAANFIPDDVKKKAHEIPWSQIRGMRNILVHGYDVVDEEVVWKTAQQDFQKLKVFIERLKSET